MVPVYRVKTRLEFKFEKVMADKVTDMSVFVKGNRQAKFSDGVRYFVEFGEAQRFAVDYLRGQINKAQLEESRAQSAFKAAISVTDDTLEVSSSAW